MHQSKPDVEDRVRLLLLLDHALFRASLGRFLASEPGFEVTGECGTSAEALAVLASSTIDIVLLEFAFGADRANDFISAARNAGYQARFLLVAESVDASHLAILRLGASGVFPKSEAPDRLVQAIKVVATGGASVDPRIIQLLANQSVNQPSRVMETGSASPLEDREQKVILGILGGLTSKKIGSEMGLSESSIKNILQHLFVKAGVSTRSQLVRWALEGSLGHKLVKKAGQ